jgi:hypothetical protein
MEIELIPITSREQHRADTKCFLGKKTVTVPIRPTAKLSTKAGLVRRFPPSQWPKIVWTKRLVFRSLEPNREIVSAHNDGATVVMITG